MPANCVKQEGGSTVIASGAKRSRNVGRASCSPGSPRRQSPSERRASLDALWRLAMTERPLSSEASDRALLGSYVFVTPYHPRPSRRVAGGDASRRTLQSARTPPPSGPSFDARCFASRLRMRGVTLPAPLRPTLGVTCFRENFCNLLESLESRKEKAWVFLPLAWIFLPHFLGFAWFCLVGVGSAPVVAQPERKVSQERP